MNESSASNTKKFTGTNALQTYISLIVFIFDILSFIVVAFVAVQFGKAIYPSKTAAISLLIVWGGFVAGSVLRPIGSMIVGPLYDRVGRKRGVFIGVIGTSVFTASMAALPTYAQVGIWAPVIYIILRLVAGLFVGALVAGGLVFTTENVPEKVRGFITGFAEAGGNWAHIIGAAWLALAAAIFTTTAAFDANGWRFFFLVSLLPLVLVIPPLMKVKESELFVKAKGMQKTAANTEGVYKKLLGKGSAMRRPFIISLIMSVGVLSFADIMANNLPTFLKLVIGIPPSHVASIILVAAAFGVVGNLTGGTISQKLGRKRWAIILSVFLILVSFLNLYLRSLTSTDFFLIVATLIPLYIVFSMSEANLVLFLNESFSTEVRSTAVGLNWNVGYAVGGVLILIITYLYGVYGISSLPVIETAFLVAMGAIFLITAVIQKETIGNISREEAKMDSDYLAGTGGK